MRQTNEALAECEIPLAIEDLGFHDLRSKAGDDAEEASFDMHSFLGNTPAVRRQALRAARAQGCAAPAQTRRNGELRLGNRGTFAVLLRRISGLARLAYDTEL